MVRTQREEAQHFLFVFVFFFLWLQISLCRTQPVHFRRVALGNLAGKIPAIVQTGPEDLLKTLQKQQSGGADI